MEPVFQPVSNRYYRQQCASAMQKRTPMSSAKNQLRSAIFKALSGNVSLVSRLGGNNIFDAVPERTPLPYVVLDRTVSADWSTSTEDGESHTIFLHIWSDTGGRDQVDGLENAVRSTLETQPVLADHHLIHLRFQQAETARNSARDQFHTVLRFAAVTEPK